MNDNFKNKPFYILGIAVVILVVVSLLPISRISGGKLRDFNLFSDISALASDAPVMEDNSAAPIDKALLAAEAEEEIEVPPYHAPADTAVAGKQSGHDSVTAAAEPVVLPPVVESRQGDIVVMEDYSPAGDGLAHFKAALAQSGSRVVRVAVLGDSYIEGDIFTQNVREQLQDVYGGSGVGYVNMYSEFPGFRRSVRQSGSGWDVHTVSAGNCRSSLVSLSEQYSTPSGNATATYKGVSKYRHLDAWEVSRCVFVSSGASRLTTKTGGDSVVVHEVEASTRAQCITVPGTTSAFTVKSSDKSLAAIGVWLDGVTGISVDCMSSRGYSGVTLSKVSKELSESMREFIDYDLIVLEFGINAMSASQTNYSSYSRLMVKVIHHLKECYPRADIIVMGIGDRGQKSGADIVSMKTAAAMTAAQRDIARNTGCVFWDTREAMGGENSIVAWAKADPPRANKDYIHLTHHGGSVLAKEFVKSLLHAVKN